MAALDERRNERKPAHGGSQGWLSGTVLYWRNWNRQSIRLEAA
jgi:hypothetical protein